MIDAHFHLWDLARPECTWPTGVEALIHRDHLLPEYRGIARSAGIAKAVLVQTQENAADTAWLLALASEEPLVGAVVGWADLAAQDAAEAICALALQPKLRGLRPMVQGRASDWYDRPELDAALAAMAHTGLRLDALVRVPHLDSLNRLARRFPTLAIVIDHAAKPEIGAADGYDAWYRSIAPLADRPNVHCKLSGLLTECPEGQADPELLLPYVSALLNLFGAERLMWGSDWPVLNMAGNYADWLEIARTLVPAGMHASVFDVTARVFYGLGDAGA